MISLCVQQLLVSNDLLRLTSNMAVWMPNFEDLARFVENSLNDLYLVKDLKM